MFETTSSLNTCFESCKQLTEHQKTHVSWYDYGFRFYDPALARWHCVDPMGEDYLSLSPYVYCANNPIIFVDPTGMKFSGDTNAVNQLEAQAQSNVKAEQNTQARIQSRIDRRTAKGRSTTMAERSMARSEFRETNYQATVDEIGELRASDNTYNINTSYVPPGAGDPDGFIAYGSTDADGNYTINVNISSGYMQEGGLAHELVHGYQFEKGWTDLNANGTRGILHDISDEVVAFTRQLAFTHNSAMYSVNAAYVRGLQKNGNSLYRDFPQGPLNINSPAGLIYYQHTGKVNLSTVKYKDAGYSYIFNNR